MRECFDRKIIGDCSIVEEYVKKKRETKNTITETIVRKTVKAFLLECGHRVRLTELGNVPKRRRVSCCYNCLFEKEETQEREKELVR